MLKIVKKLSKLSTCWSRHVMSCLKGHKSLGSLCNVKSKSPQWVSQSVTRSPIELLWTAKNQSIIQVDLKRRKIMHNGRKDKCQVILCSFVSFIESNLNILNFEFSCPFWGKQWCKMLCRAVSYIIKIKTYEQKRRW